MKELLVRWGHFLRRNPRRTALIVWFFLPGILIGIGRLAIRLGILEEGTEYSNSRIRSKVWMIHHYDRGVPSVILDDQRSMLFFITGQAGKDYLQAGDSVVKEAKTHDLTVYRKYKDSTVVSVFGHGGAIGGPYSGMISRRVERR